MIKHIWFDVEGVLTTPSEKYHKLHNDLRYKTYAEVVNKSVTDELKKEYEGLYKKYASNSAVFTSLGKPSDFWQKSFNTLDKKELYEFNPKVRSTLERLKDIVPISIFANPTKDATYQVLETINAKPEWFQYIVCGDDIKQRKPALNGFYLMIKKSKLPTNEILYVGDRVKVDVLPAKKVGMQTCLLYSKSKEADYSFEKFEDILSIVK